MEELVLLHWLGWGLMAILLITSAVAIYCERERRRSDGSTPHQSAS